MSKINQFFEEMEALFLKGDQEAFEDISEDLKEHIEIQLSEGLSEEAILAKLGTPEELVAEFYEEQRLHTALVAETDVVAIEDVKDVYLHERKERIFEAYQRIRRLLTMALQIILVALGVFAGIYLLLEALREHHLALLPLLIVITSCYGLWQARRSKRVRYEGRRSRELLGLGGFIGLICLIVGMVATNSFFYQGKELSQTIRLEPSQIKEVRVKSEFPVDLITLPTSQSEIIIEIKGRGKIAAKTLLETLSTETNSLLNLDFGKRGLFDSFTNIGALEVVLHLPRQMVPEALTFDLARGVIQAQDLAVGKLDIELEAGEFNAENLRADHLSFDSQRADLILNGYQTEVKAMSQQGKIILKNGIGQTTVQTANGFVNLIGIEAPKAKVTSLSGKVIVTETTISALDIESQANAVVLDRQTGDTTVNLEKGKLVVTDHTGSLIIANKEASIIVNQEAAIAGSIDSQSGLVKWVQGQSGPMSFDVSSEKGKVVNEMTKIKGNSPPYVIKSQTGDINLYDRVSE